MKKTKRTVSSDKDLVFDRISSSTPSNCDSLKKTSKPIVGRDRHEYERKRRLKIEGQAPFTYQKGAPRQNNGVFLGHKLDTVEPAFDVYEFDADMAQLADAAGEITSKSERLVAAVDHIQKALDLLKDDTPPLERRRRHRLSMERFKHDKTQEDLVLSFREAADLAQGKIAIACNTLSQAGAILRNTLVKRKGR